MTHVTLADVILRHVPLTAREAVTLTLAVAREWDRQRAVHGPVSLPDDGSIQLHDTGGLSFLAAPGSTSATNTLGSLLGRLLATDETESSRQGAAFGVMVKAPGTAGADEVPTVPDDSFRSVLARFSADDCATVVAAIVERTATFPAGQMVEVTPARARGYAGPERRRQPRIVAELRLDIRELERELYALRSTPKPAPSSSTKSRKVGVAGVVLGGAAACVVALLTILAVERSPLRGETKSVDAAVSDAGSTHGDSGSASSAAVGVELDSRAATEERRIAKSAAVERASVSARRTVTAHQRVASKTPARSRPHATFAGGARSITWLANPR